MIHAGKIARKGAVITEMESLLRKLTVNEMPG